MDEITSIDWDITPKDGETYGGMKERIKKAKEFLMYPNKNRESWAIIQRAWLKDILELDAGVLVKVFTRDSYDWENIEPKSGAPMLKPKGQRQMTEIYARDGASFLYESDKFGFIGGFWQYSYQIPAHPIWFDRQEICYAKRNHRSSSVYGYAPTQAILDLVKSLYYSTIYNKKFFEETAIPDGVLSVLNMDEEGKKNLLGQWTDSFKGQPHKFAVVNQDIKWLPLTALQRELEFLETQTWYYKLIIAMYGLTPAELGITDDVNKSTSTTQAELSRRKGIRPLLKLMEKYINEEIMPEVDEELQFQYIYDDPIEMNKKLANWEMMLNMHIKTPNEIREEMGLEPIKGGDEMYDRYGLGQGGQNKFGDGEEGKGNEEGEKAKEVKKNAEFFKKYKVDNEGKYAHERFDLSKADLLSDSGSDRSAYEMPDGKILKIVKTARGLAQNLAEGVKWKLLPVMYEKGKDYVIVEKVDRDDKRTNEMLRGMQGYRGDDWAKKTPGLLREFKRLSKEYPDCEFDEIINHDLIFGDFKKAKNWGWKEDKPYLLDAGTIMPEILDKNFVSQFKELWFEIVKVRREARRKGNAVLTKSFDLIKSKYKKMSYEELIAEHKKLVQVLEDQDPDELDDELKEQKAELESYIAEYEKLSKGINDGQYYKDPPEVIGNNPSVVYQPQNAKLMEESKEKRSLKDSQEELKDKNTCPYCGHPTLSEEKNENASQESRFNCAFCHAHLELSDLMDKSTLEELSNLMMGNNQTKPVSVPGWSPKSCDCEICKSADDLILAKDYVGFDYQKSKDDIIRYILSKEYEELLMKFFKDLDIKIVYKIKQALIDGTENNKSISQIAYEINKFLKDKDRSNIIARNELLRTVNEGNKMRMKGSGIKKVIWLAAKDERTCPICKKRDHKIYDIDKVKNPIDVHVNCRCTYTDYVEI